MSTCNRTLLAAAGGKPAAKPDPTAPQARASLWSYMPLVLLALTFTLPLLFMISPASSRGTKSSAT